jgi:hypothetical protein
MREILVCITFREFDGSVNDHIQRKTLESIKKQTYKNYKLIVTGYREKNVLSVLDEFGLPYIYIQSDLEKEYSHSWTEVIENSFRHLIMSQHIIYWTQSDTIIEPNYFDQINKIFKAGIAGTSWPVLYHNTIDDYHQGVLTDNESIYKKIPGSPYKHFLYQHLLKHIPKTSFLSIDANSLVPECVFIDGDIFLDKKNMQIFSQHKICGAFQGLTQTLMLAMFSKQLVNIFFMSKAYEIKNDFGDDAEWWHEVKDKLFFKQQLVNKEILNQFIKERGLSEKYKINNRTSPVVKLNIHSKYKIIGNQKQKILFSFYLLIWRINNFVSRLTGFVHKPYDEKKTALKNLRSRICERIFL